MDRLTVFITAFSLWWILWYALSRKNNKALEEVVYNRLDYNSILYIYKSIIV